MRWIEASLRLVDSRSLCLTERVVEQLDETALNIYTDGSCLPSPRRGGLGYVFITVDDSGHEVIHTESPPGWRYATNNQMELQAVIEALAFALGRRSPFGMSDLSRNLVK